MIPLGYCTRKETFLNVGSSFNRDIVGHGVAVTGGPDLGDEVIADVLRYKAMYTYIGTPDGCPLVSVVDCAIPAAKAFR